MKKLKKYIQAIFPIFLIGVLVFLYSFTSKRNSNKKLDKISVHFMEKNHSFLTESMVNKMLIQNEQPVKKLPKTNINLHWLENTVLSNPFVHSVSVFMSIDGELKTTLKQRKPIARIITEKESYYIDNEGVRLPLSNFFTARVPLVSGAVKTEKIEEITTLLNKVTTDDFLRKEITDLLVLENNEYAFLVRSGSYSVQLGNVKNIDKKLKKLKAFYGKTFKDKTIKQYKEINLKYHNQVVCTKIKN